MQEQERQRHEKGGYSSEESGKANELSIYGHSGRLFLLNQDSFISSSSVKS